MRFSSLGRAAKSAMLLLAVAVVGTTTAIAATSGSSDAIRGVTISETPPVEGPNYAPGTGSMPAAAAASFQILRRPRTADDAIDASGPVGSLLAHANPSLSRRISGTGDQAVFVVPGQEDICVLAANGSGGCSPIGQAAKIGEISSSLCRPGLADGFARLYGLIPDGAGVVTIDGVGGFHTVVDLQDGGFTLDVPRTAAPATLSWTSAAGPVVNTLPIPDSSVGVRCAA